MSDAFDRAMTQAVNDKRRVKFMKVGLWSFVAGFVTTPILNALGVL